MQKAADSFRAGAVASESSGRLRLSLRFCGRDLGHLGRYSADLSIVGTPRMHACVCWLWGLFMLPKIWASWILMNPARGPADASGVSTSGQWSVVSDRHK